MIKMKIWWIFSAWSVTAVSAHAAEPPVPVSMALPVLVKQALEQNEGLAALEARIQQRQLAAGQQLAGPNPSVGAALGQKQGDAATGFLYEVSVSQVLSTGGKQEARYQLALMDMVSARLQKGQAERILSSEVIRAAFEYALRLQRQMVRIQRQERLKLVHAFLASHEFPSPQQRAERWIVEGRLRTAEMEALVNQREVQVALEGLNLYLRWPEPRPLVLSVPRLKGTVELPKVEWLQRALDHNADLAAQRLAIETAKKEKTVLETEVSPDLELSAFFRNESAGEMDRAIGVGVSLPLPFFDRNERAIQSAEHKISAEQRTLEWSTRQLRVQFARWMAEYDAARLRLARYPEAFLTALRSHLQEAEAEFEKGRVNLVTLLELDAEVTEAHLNALDAQDRLIETLQALWILVGEPDMLAQLEIL